MRENLIFAKSKSHSSAAFRQELGILVDVPAYGRNLVGELCGLTLVLDVVTLRSVDWAICNDSNGWNDCACVMSGAFALEANALLKYSSAASCSVTPIMQHGCMS